MLRDCENAEMRDRLPELMHGRLTGTERESVAAHVAACADCTAELALLERTRAELAVRPAVDVPRIVSALPRAVPATGGQPIPIHRRPAMRLAASVAFIVVAGSALAVALGRDEGGVGSWSGGVVAISPSNSAAGATTSARGSEPAIHAGAPARATNGSRGMSLGGGVADLSEGEMESLLAALESFDGVPAAEPPSEIAPINGGGY